MSELSAQCDELRAMAVSVGLAMPQAATLMMEAADTIRGLVDERERLFRANVKKNGEMLRLVGENAKLRELVKDLHTLAGDVLPERNTDYFTIRSVEWCIDYYSKTMPAIEQRMREMGIEADE